MVGRAITLGREMKKRGKVRTTKKVNKIKSDNFIRSKRVNTNINKKGKLVSISKLMAKVKRSKFSRLR